MISPTPIGYEKLAEDMITIDHLEETMGQTPTDFDDLTLNQKCLLIDRLEETMGQTAEEYHQQCVDEDHEEALQKNETWDTLQAIIDDDSVTQAQNIIAKLRRNWIVEALTRE